MDRPVAVQPAVAGVSRLVQPRAAALQFRTAHSARRAERDVRSGSLVYRSIIH